MQKITIKQIINIWN